MLLTDSKNSTIIKASGGIVWKKVSGEYRLAVVYRDRYGNEWSLPKGKLEESETWKECAQREVKEEVGVTTRILGFADTITYSANETPKVVVFWHMLATGTSTIPIDPETVKIKWLAPNEAVRILDYEDERDLVRDTKYPEKKGFFSITNLFADFRRLIERKFIYNKIVRIESELKILEYELSVTKQQYNNEEHKLIYHGLEHLVNLAQKEVDDNQVDTAWKIYNLIRRIKYLTFDETQLENEAKILQNEAEKLNEWRKKAVNEIIADEKNSPKKLNPSHLIHAARIKDEHYDSAYYKNKLSSSTIRLLTIILLICLGLLSIWVNLNFEESTDLNNLIENGTKNTPRSIKLGPVSFGVFLFGVLGACISSLFHLRDTSKNTRIPEMLSGITFTLTRVLIGGISALIIMIYLESDFSELLFKDISLRPNSIYAYLSIAFIAGFTERLLLKAVASVVGKE